jgi:hypothetical protein
MERTLIYVGKSLILVSEVLMHLAVNVFNRFNHARRFCSRVLQAVYAFVKKSSLHEI